MLNIQHLKFAYAKHQVYTDLNLSLEAGAIYGLLGPNGAGKSTLLYLIAGLLTPQAGKITFNGVDTAKRRPSTLENIFILPEEFTLPDITLEKYLKVNSRMYPRFSVDDLKSHLATFDMTTDIHLGELSMGQKKKAFMCFALACNTSLLLMDEPTNGLDIPAKSRFRKFIASTMNDERTIIISTHQVRDIDRLLDHIIMTGNGNIILNNSISEISSRLSFQNVYGSTPPADALYAQPSLGGYNVILRNTDDSDTEVNLESLFEFAQTQPELINSILQPSTTLS